jgi:predicted nucleic acid-binding protein
LIAKAHFVLDCSVTMAWCFEDERTEHSESILDRLQTESALVPSLWSVDAANVMLISERRGRLTTIQTSQFVNVLKSLPIIISPIDADSEMDALLTLARICKLTSYDAAYLALAQRTGLPLATLDRELIAAAPLAGVELL